jgi:hypothetical protein
MKRLITMTLGAVLLGLHAATPAQSTYTFGADYSAAQLLSPCQEADNDARWGEAAETECEQYIMGFIAGLEHAGAVGSGGSTCPPETNTADEARWAFMRWVHGDFSKRRAMTAPDALLAALQASFPCK